MAPTLNSPRPFARLQAALAGLAALLCAAAPAATITSASPVGQAGRVQQLALRFDVPVVALDGGSAADPATLVCQGPAPAGSGRWVTPQHWVFDLRDALPPGVACELRVRSGWKPIDGVLTGRTGFAFRTGGPAVEDTVPYAGSTIEEEQHFLLRFNGPPDAASVAARSACEIEGIGERVPVRLVTGAARDAVLRAQRREKSAERHVLLACQRALPGARRVRLVLGPGIAAAANPAAVTREATVLEFQVRRPFEAEFSCERERAQAPCLPIRPLSVRFSEPVSRAAAQQVRLQPLAAGAAALAPVFDADDRSDEVHAVRFPVPLPPNARFRIELPAGLQDSAGRRLANAASFPLEVATGEAPPIAKFAAAPFGILERLAEPVLPLTLRHVQGDLRPGASGGQVRVLREQDPLAMLKAYARVASLHERRIKARDAGLPASAWTETVTATDARGRTVRRQVDRWVGTREVSMLRDVAAARRLDLPALQGGDPRPFEVVGIPLAEPGLHVVEVESAQLGAALLASAGAPAPQPMYVRTAVLVTNLAVHFKHARENSLAWVTTLDRAQPVAGAQVQVLDCAGKTLWSGRTDAAGRAPIAQTLPQASGDCLADPGLFVAASARDASGVTDTAFVFSTWNRGIDPWRFGLPVGSPDAPAEVRAHTVFDRTLLRAGETVSMKHFVRRETPQGLAMPPARELPTRAVVTHEGSGQEYSLPLQWGGARSTSSSWAIPAAARLGRYRVDLESAGDAPGQVRRDSAGSFRVEEFRVPLVDARIVPPRAPQVAPREVALDLQLSYLAGGPMAQAALRGTAQWRERSLDFPEHPGFSFQPPRGAGPEAPPEADDESPVPTARLVADRVPLTTDRDGAARWTIALPAAAPDAARPGELRAEVSYLDPNGEVQTATARVPVWPSGVVVGLRTSSWVSARGQVPLTALALDIRGKPLRGQAVEVRARLRQNLSTRKRLVGGLYAYDNRTELQELGVVCSGRTDDHGRLSCEASLDRAGEVELVAQARDADGRAAQAATSVWVTRQGELWFAQDDDDRIDVLPEKSRLEPGETARLQVRMPFREATALVAVEREGVIDTRVVTLRGSDPTIELKIEPGHGPNVYVSVLAVRGRIRHVPWYSFFRWGWKEPLAWARAFWHEGREYRAPTAMVDLARPGYRFGVAALRVGTGAYTTHVQVTTDRPQYAIRGTAVARIRATLPDGKPAAGADVAFAAVDEGLLALAPNDSWQLLEGLVRERAWGVATSTAQGEVIGRRHYGRKAVPAGGGGGRAGARELFDTLLLWKPDITLDSKGEATVEVPLNDSLTGFRLVAVADAGVQAFGTGQVTIRVTQDLQLLPGLPPLAREGDRFAAGVTLRNTTGRALTLRASLTGSVHRGGAGDTPAADAARLELPARVVEVPAGGAREVTWDIEVPAGARRIAWEAFAEEASAAAGQARLQDRARWQQQVLEAVPARVLQAALQQLDGPLGLPVAPPPGALSMPGGELRGGLSVAVQARLATPLPALRRYFEDYPYTCLEQRASKAIGLRDAALWSTVMRALPTHLDGDGLAGFFPPSAADTAQGSDRLTAYLVGAADEAGWSIPQPTLEAMLQGLSAFVQGRIERRPWAPRSDLEVRKLAAIAALARHGRADVRMLGSIRTGPDALAQWPTAAVIDWLTILQRLPGVAGGDARRTEALQQLRARLVLSGTMLRFSREDDDFWWWLMDSPDANAARLILALVDEPGWREELPRLVAGHLGRQREGRWLTTTANAWSVLALERFSARFESNSVGGRALVSLPGRTPQAVDLAGDGGQVLLPWPSQPATLAVAHEGSGKPWVTVQGLAAIPRTAPVSRGYTLTRSVSAVEQKKAGVFSRADVLRVRLEVQAAADMTWVVLADPVPAGATILGTGLGRDAAIATGGERQQGGGWVAYDERSQGAFRRYWGYLPKGTHTVEYTIRLNTPGRYQLPPARVEAMYAPDSFGEVPASPLEVQP